jgi:hypothetical protein
MVTVAGTARSGTGIKVSLLFRNQVLMGPSLTGDFRPTDYLLSLWNLCTRDLVNSSHLVPGTYPSAPELQTIYPWHPRASRLHSIIG